MEWSQRWNELSTVGGFILDLLGYLHDVKSCPDSRATAKATRASWAWALIVVSQEGFKFQRSATIIGSSASWATLKKTHYNSRKSLFLKNWTFLKSRMTIVVVEK